MTPQPDMRAFRGAVGRVPSHTDILALRRFLAAILVLALGLGGIGRATATTADAAPAYVVIAGTVVSLCADSAQTGGGEASGARHACDQCPVATPTLLPEPPTAEQPVASRHVAEPSPRMAAIAPRQRPYSPRQPTGPPAA